jgi:hypothetical protein
MIGYWPLAHRNPRMNWGIEYLCLSVIRDHQRAGTTAIQVECAIGSHFHSYACQFTQRCPLTVAALSPIHNDQPQRFSLPVYSNGGAGV